MNISRRDLLFASTAGAALLSSCSTAPPSAETAVRPNIVYIIVDDLGMDLGCYGGTQIPTPNIDQLAKEGMRFTEAYSGCTVCAPARSTLLTGTHMGHTPVRRNSGGVSLQADTFTVAQMLEKAGYTCGGFGKWGVGDLDTAGVPERHGFSRFVGYYHQVHAHYFYPEYIIDTGRKVPLPENEGVYGEKGQRPAGPVPMPDAASGKQRTFTHYRVLDEMKRFLRENKDRPFFCYAPWTIPHGRFEIPENDPAWQQFKDKPWSINARIYAAYVSLADRCVGEVLALLKELGIDDRTAVFFSSDNGAAAQYPGELDSTGSFRGGKTSMYEGGIRIPFLARWPGKFPAGVTSNLPVYFPDFLPTAAAIAGIPPEVPQQLDGVSLLPELTGAQKLSRERQMYWEWNRDHFDEYVVYMQACRHGNWKLVRNKPEDPWELYDLAADVAESSNLAAAQPERVRQMEAWIAANRVDPPPQIEPEKPEGQRWR
jgi:arylsulfatase A-like enzyme